MVMLAPNGLNNPGKKFGKMVYAYCTYIWLAAENVNEKFVVNYVCARRVLSAISFARLSIDGNALHNESPVG